MHTTTALHVLPGACTTTSNFPSISHVPRVIITIQSRSTRLRCHPSRYRGVPTDEARMHGSRDQPCCTFQQSPQGVTRRCS